jgi:hypothetical protein
MKGFFELKTPMPRYSVIWDVKIVLDYLECFDPVSDLGLKELTLKLVMLLALVTGQRAQTLFLLNINNMFVRKMSFTFYFDKPLKQVSASIKSPLLVLQPFTPNHKLCVVKTLQEYLKRTEQLRIDQNGLFISYQKPHHNVSKETISHWLKIILHECGFDTSNYTGHSTRAASTSAALNNQASLNEIISTAGWKNANVFGKFYNKPIDSGPSFADAVLGGNRIANSL